MMAGANSEYVKRSCCVLGSAGWLLCRLLVDSGSSGDRRLSGVRPHPTNASSGSTTDVVLTCRKRLQPLQSRSSAPRRERQERVAEVQ